mgnify:FL=1
MQITKERLKEIIKEELEVTLTNEEAGELFGETVQEQLDEQQLNEDFVSMLQNVTPENLQIVANAMIKMGTETGPFMLAAALGAIGIEAAKAAMTAKDAEDLVDQKEAGGLVQFLEDELTNYERFKK